MTLLDLEPGLVIKKSAEYSVKREVSVKLISLYEQFSAHFLNGNIIYLYYLTH
jgi:hypothetical protein